MGIDYKIDYLGTVRFAFYISLIAIAGSVVIEGFRGLTDLAISFLFAFGVMTVLGFIVELISKYILKPEWFKPMKKEKIE